MPLAITARRRSAHALLLTIAATAASGCAHAPRAAVLRPAAAQDCEAAAVALAARPAHPAGDLVRRAFTTPAAWLLTGTAYVTDFTATAVGGVGAGVGICLPLIALEGALRASGEASGQCVGSIAGAAISTGGIFGLGDLTAGATRSWRCLDRVGEAREVLAAAGCFTARDWPGDRDVALVLLTRFHEDHGRFRCTPERQRRAIAAALDEVSHGAPAGQAQDVDQDVEQAPEQPPDQSAAQEAAPAEEAEDATPPPSDL